MTLYRRRLPHWQPDHVPIFLTWRLAGTLPRFLIPTGVSEGARFASLDRQLDRATTGPLWLKEERVAQCVMDTLYLGAGEWELYELHAWVIMANHVHMLIQPHRPLREITRAVKSTSARLANRILSLEGQRFWQIESYDHWVRNQREFDRIVGYIEWNPVMAGLVEKAEDWRWSSAGTKAQARACVTS